MFTTRLTSFAHVARTSSNPLIMMHLRAFASPTKKTGLNDQLKDAQEEAKKYGIKRRFYDHMPTIVRQLPQGQ